MPHYEDKQRSAHASRRASPSQSPRTSTPPHPLLQLQRSAGNQAALQLKSDTVIQRGGGKDGVTGGGGGWLGGMFSGMPKFSGMSWGNFGQDTMNQTVREAVSAGFGSDSVDIYDMWKLRNDPAKLDQFMRDRIYRMDGGYQ
ncbi:hypothetical protein IDH44_09375 [Paenibacillus sp. IB182496]|uniref:Uncharacterized protein n=1 Tax=Paenibacillus sabuli TaxID=2772509 RepID=A0A927GR98_9BACL|nr:hypothetical protein [Paenibacillus sabuli]MBD2845399.1 hypothetical protein [Paenibacillus sabuli]